MSYATTLRQQLNGFYSIAFDDGVRGRENIDYLKQKFEANVETCLNSVIEEQMLELEKARIMHRQSQMHPQSFDDFLELHVAELKPAMDAQIAALHSKNGVHEEKYNDLIEQRFKAIANFDAICNGMRTTPVKRTFLDLPIGFWIILFTICGVESYLTRSAILELRIFSDLGTNIFCAGLAIVLGLIVDQIGDSIHTNKNYSS